MTQSKRPLPSHFVVYDYRNPSPVFTKEQIAFIESIRDDFSDEDLAWIRQFEWFRINLNVNLMADGAIPGLRIEPRRATLYLKRFSSEPFRKMIDVFFKSIPLASLQDACLMREFRVTIPNGDRYYPMSFSGNIERCMKTMEERARLCGTSFGWFDHGKFILSGGEKIDFKPLRVETFEGRDYPKDW